MADDVTFQPTVATPPTGTKVATDDVGGSHFQKVKLDLGADGASDPVVGTVPVSGTVALSGTSTVEGEVSIVDSTGDSAMDDANDALRVNVVAGGGGGTQYDEGDTDASITGTAILWEDAGDTLRPVSVAKPLPVTIDGTVASAEVKITDGTDDAEVTSEGNLQTITPNRTASGTLGALDEALAIDTDGMGSVQAHFTASDLVGTVVIEGYNGSTWVRNWLAYDDQQALIDSAVSPVANEYLWASCGPFLQIRVRVVFYVSGSTTVRLVTGVASSPVVWAEARLSDVNGNLGAISGAGAVYVSPRDGDGDSITDDANDALRVNVVAGTVAVTEPVTVDGTVAVTGVSTAANQTTEIGHLATIAGDTTAIETAVQIIDDWDESDRAKVNPIAGQAGVQGASGTVTALTQRVVLATDVALPAGTNNIGDVDVLSSVLPTGAATAALQLPDGHNVTVDNAAGASAVPIQDGGNIITVDGTVTANLAAGSNNIGDVDVLSIAAGDNNIGNVDIVTMPNVTLNEPVTVDGTVTANPTLPGTAVLSNVNDTAASTTLLSANAARLGATIHNDSTAILYVKFGTTASTTSYTVKMVADAYYEVPFGYTGRIDGIWASDASGAARITEVSA